MRHRTRLILVFFAQLRLSLKELADGRSDSFRTAGAEYPRDHVSSSLPFDSGGRLRRDVVADAVDAANLVNDARGYLREDFVRE